MALHGWESPQDNRRIVVSEPAVRDLRMLAIEGLAALPRRGIEVGGILFGEARGREVWIETFEEAPCEHRYGPSYALSESDRAKLSELLARRCGGPLPVVGFFRSFASRDPQIEEADEAFVRAHFPQGDFLYLMLQPLSVENCVASLRFFRDGQLLPETDDAPFAFDHRQIPVIQPLMDTTPEPHREMPLTEKHAENAAEPPPLPTPVKLPHLVREREEATDRTPAELPAWMAEPTPRRARWWIPALICLVLGVGGTVIYQLWTQARELRWTELHLDVRPVGKQLEVSWDANAPRALNATRGLLAVTDGDTHHDAKLDSEQIRAGKYTYIPSHADVGVRLILYANGQGVAGDAVRLAAIPNPAIQPQNRPAVVAKPVVSGEADRAAPPRPQPAVPPLTVHEVQPRIPEGIRSRITEQVVIPVEVEVSERGRVLRAVAETEGRDGVGRYLAEQAQKAAREWRFTPARTKSGTRVAASKTIHFVFTP